MKTILIDAKHCLIIEKENKYEIFRDMYKLLETYLNKKIILTNASYDGGKLYDLNRIPYEIFTLKNNPNKKDPE